LETTVAKGSIEPIGDQQTLRDKLAVEASRAQRSPFDLEVDPAELGRLSRPNPWRLSHLMYLIAVVAIVLWLGIVVAGSVLAVVLMAAAIVLLVFVAAMGATVILAWGSTTKQDALLHILAIAAERGIPLAPAVAAFADQYRGVEHRRIMLLAARLNWGATLADGLDGARRVVTRDAILLAWVGQAAGLLAKALRMAAQSRSSQLPIWTNIAARLAYILVLMLGMQGVSGFVLYYIIPKFEAIFRDFNLPLPSITIAVIRVAQFFVQFAAPVALLPMFEVGLLIFLPISFLGWGSYHVPIFDRLLGRRHTALALRSLSLIVEGGKPISLGIGVLADHYPTYWFRRRLRGAAAYVRGGTDWIEALRRHHVIRSADAAVLASAESVGNLAWALAELALTAERRLTTRMQLVTQTLFPLVVVILGMVVFVMAIAYFLPLVTLIQSLA
jgi:type II secretory pathway component PulF